jgi:hypothetical protein
MSYLQRLQQTSTFRSSPSSSSQIKTLNPYPSSGTHHERHRTCTPIRLRRKGCRQTRRSVSAEKVQPPGIAAFLFPFCCQRFRDRVLAVAPQDRTWARCSQVKRGDVPVRYTCRLNLILFICRQSCCSRKRCHGCHISLQRFTCSCPRDPFFGRLAGASASARFGISITVSPTTRHMRLSTFLSARFSLWIN